MSSSQPTTTTHPQHISSLIITGVTMGIFHVLTGPDHLSAIATLSANVGHSTAFWLGVRWGIGHSTGLCIVAGILIAMSSSSSSGGKKNDGDDDADNVNETIDMSSTLSSLLESIVGICMIILGLYGFYKAIEERRRRILQSRLPFSIGSSLSSNDKAGRLRTRRPRRFGEGRRATAYTTVTVDIDTDSEVEEELTKESHSKNGDVDDDMMTIEMTIIPSAQNNDDSSLISVDIKKDMNGTTETTTTPPKKDNDDEDKNDDDSSHNQSSSHDDDDDDNPPTSSHHHHHHHHHQPKILSCLIGIVHGIAGPGGVLGVIPAVQLRNAALASLYLSVFCFTSMIVMGLFAGFYGVLSRRVVWFCSSSQGGDLSSFVVKMISSSLSVFVGVMWLVLIGMGMLDDVFP